MSNIMQNKTREITLLAIGIAILIGGGIGIYMASGLIPIPGTKYALMAPFLSIVLYVVLSQIKSVFAISKLGVVFAAIMTTINPFMGIAILFTTIMTQITVIVFKGEEARAFYGSIAFSIFTGVSGLFVTGLKVWGQNPMFLLTAILIISLLCGAFGTIGAMTARKIIGRLQVSNSSKS